MPGALMRMRIVLRRIGVRALLRWAVRWLRLRLKIATVLRPRLQRQLRHVDNSNGRTFRVLVPLLETSHYQYHQVLILAKALQLRGADVRVLLCDGVLPGCELKNSRNARELDPCLNCRLNRQHLVPLYGLPVTYLSEFTDAVEFGELQRQADRIAEAYPAEHIVRGMNIIPAVNESVTRYYFGGDPPTRSDLKRVQSQHIASCLLGLHVAEQFSMGWNPDVVLNNMDVYSGWQPYFDHFHRSNRARTITVSITQFNYNSVVLNSGALYKSRARFEQYMGHRAHRPLNDVERRELEEFLSARKEGRSAIFADLGFFGTDKDRKFDFATGKRNIFLFANVAWDVGISGGDGLYASVIEWVIRTAQMIVAEPDCVLYIKPHPAEVFDTTASAKGVADHVREAFGGRLADNVRIIEPQWRINTYSLFQHIDVAVVFNGTLGIELALDGIPTIGTGQLPYSDLGFVTTPKSEAEYRELLRGGTELPAPDVQAAREFAYFYFVRACIPWTLTERAYGDDFRGFTFPSVDEIRPGRDAILDHLCEWIFDPTGVVLEAWPEQPAGVGSSRDDPWPQAAP
jgi:hypothetical protein